MRLVATRAKDPDWQGPTPLPWRYDDGGRAAAGYGIATDARDCVCRSIAIATRQPYREVYEALAARHAARKGGRRSARDGLPRKVYEPYLLDLGWAWFPTMAIGQGTTVHLADGELPAGRLVVAVSKHMTAVVDGTVRDNHDPGRGGTRCVYGYYYDPTHTL